MVYHISTETPRLISLKTVRATRGEAGNKGRHAQAGVREEAEVMTGGGGGSQRGGNDAPAFVL